MKVPSSLIAVFVLVPLMLAACAPDKQGAGLDGEHRSAPPAIQRTLVMISAGELPSFSERIMLPSGPAVTTRSGGNEVLNAKLAFRDERGVPFPVLAEGLPALNTATWQVFPDGKMETSYRLKPNLTWHDGQPLTAEDFAFAWRLYATPTLGVSSATGTASSGSSPGFRLLEDVRASDPQTVVLRWKQPYPDAVDDVAVLPPLPRHILEQPLQQLEPDPFLSLPFWREDYIGAGPFKLERREPGVSFEASAFDGFPLGRPRIDRVRVIYIPDVNTSIATLLAGEAHFQMDGALFGEDGLALERQWGPDGGTVTYEPNSPRAMGIQMRPEFAVPTQLATDVRVRKAIAYAMDREALLETITSGKGLLRDVYTHPNADYYDAVLSAVTVRYRYDPRRAQALLEDVGFRRGADGFWVSPTGDRFTLEQWYISGGSNERESNILIDEWRAFGIDASSHLWGIQRTSAEERARTSGIFGGAHSVDQFGTRDIARAETRWSGNNRYGYSSPESDSLLDKWQTTLDRTERIGYLGQMERVLMDDLPAIPMYFNTRNIAYAAALKGVGLVLTDTAGPERKIWEWYWAA
jgi:peptide/nickel transport system substrate-binding protein